MSRGGDDRTAAVAAALEIVRFEVPPESRDALVRGHRAARRAIAAVSPPGALWSRLAELDQRRWVEVVAWERRAVFDRALERSADDPTARAWFDLAEPGYTIVVGELSRPEPAPPREGTLELAWVRGRATDPPADGGESAWSVIARSDGRTLVDPTGWVDGEPEVVRVTVHGGRRAGNHGRIAHAVDAAEESDALA